MENTKPLAVHCSGLKLVLKRSACALDSGRQKQQKTAQPANDLDRKVDRFYAKRAELEERLLKYDVPMQTTLLRVFSVMGVNDIGVGVPDKLGHFIRDAVFSADKLYDRACAIYGHIEDAADLVDPEFLDSCASFVALCQMQTEIRSLLEQLYCHICDGEKLLRQCFGKAISKTKKSEMLHVLKFRCSCFLLNLRCVKKLIVTKVKKML